MEDDWKTYSLGDISADISYGYTESASWEEIGPKFLRITDIQNDFISWDDVPYCKISEKDLIKYQVEIGDIVIARTGNSTGATAIIKTEINAVFASYLIRYRLDKKLAFPPYVDFVLRSKNWENYVGAIKGGSAQPGANAKQFAEFEFLLPPLPEQRTIASILSVLDDKIELNLQMNKTLEEMAMTLYKHWFIDFGPFRSPSAKAMGDENGEFVSSELGEIPKGWEVKPLGQLYKTTSGGTPSRSKAQYYEEGTIPWVKSKELYGNFVIKTEEMITELGLKESSAKLIPAKSVLLAMYGATVGESSILSISATCNQAICGIIEKDISYLYVFLFLRYNKTEILNQAVGSAQQNISQEIIKGLNMVSPPSDLSVFLELETYYNVIEQNLLENQTLTTLRDTLLPKLISGSVRVKDAARSLAEVL